MATPAVYGYVNDLPADPVSYTTASPSVTYPDVSQVNTFGPVYLPKIYAKELTALELASSGRIAVTIADTYAFDLDRPTAGFQGHSNVTTLQTRDAGGSLLLSTASSNAQVFLNADDGRVEITGQTALSGDTALSTAGGLASVRLAQSNVAISASNAVVIASACNASLTAYAGDAVVSTVGGTASLAAPHASVAVASNLVKITAGQALQVVSSNSADFWAAGTFNATGSNALNVFAPDAWLKLQPQVAELYAKSLVKVLASNVAVASASASATVTQDLHLSTSDGGASFALDASSKKATVAASNSLVLASAADVTLQGAGGASSLTVHGSDGTQDVVLTSGGSTTLVSTNDAVMRAANGAVALTMDHATYAMQLVAANAVLARATNSIQLAASNVVTTADQGVSTSANTLLLNAGSHAAVQLADSTGFLTLDAADHSARLCASNVAVLQSAQDVLVQGAGGASSLSVHGTDGTRDVALTAGGALRLYSSNATSLQGARGALSLTLDDLAQAMTLASSNALVAQAVNSVQVSASNVTLQAVQAVVTSGSRIDSTFLSTATLSSANGSVALALDAGAKTVGLMGANTLSLEGGQDVSLLGAGRASSLTLSGADKSVTLASGGNTTVSSASNVLLRSLGGDLSLLSQVGNVALTSASNEVVLTAGHSNVKISACNAVVTSASWTGDHYAETVAMAGGAIDATADARHTFSLTGEGQPRFTIDNTGVRVVGNLAITGSIDSLATTQTTLFVQDKVVKVAVPGSNQVMSDADADAAGLTVAGNASTVKSLLWRYQGSYDNLGTDAGLDNEPFWELKGGGLRFVLSNVAFGFRMGQRGELELVKKVGSGAARVVTRFGRTLM